jgi:hypothetical protein
MVRRLVWVALSAAAACSQEASVGSGPTSTFYRPTGVGVHGGKLVVASSNGDLRFDTATGGSVISVDPAVDRGGGLAGLVAGLNVQSFAGELAIADRDACPARDAQLYPSSVAVVPVRGESLLYLLDVDAAGAVSCAGCALGIGGTERVDPYFAGVACGADLARAYVAYLRSSTGSAWITQVDLTKAPAADGAIQSAIFGTGNIRAFAYDADRRRLYMAASGLGTGSTVTWIDFAGDCRIDADPGAGGCASGFAELPPGLEATGIALSTPDTAFPPGTPRRAYVTARVVDAIAAGSVNADGLLLVADLVDDVTGGTRLDIVHEVPVGAGLAKVVVLPKIPSRSGMRDVLAVLVSEDAFLWIYDDETGVRVSIGRDASGHPKLGSAPADVAVDPAPTANVAHLYVSSFLESFVTQVDVPIDDIESLQEPATGLRRILGGTP